MTAENEWRIAIPHGASMQVRWAAGLVAEALGTRLNDLGARRLPAFPPQAQIGPSQLPPPEAPVPSEVGAEGYVLGGDGGHILVSALTENGLTNGLLDVTRQTRVAGPGGVEPAVVQPHFQLRDMYHFPTPWALHGITTDTFTLSDWQAHIEWVRSLGANRLVVDLWTNQYYHPEFEETRINEAYWQTLREAFRYAQNLGLRTALLLFPCLVPPSIYYRYPELRAPEESVYGGIHLCWTRGKEVLTKLLSFAFEYFGHALDGAILEYWDPGMCLCSECWQDFSRTGLEIYQTYTDLAGKHTRAGQVDVVTLHVDNIATGRWWGMFDQPAPYDDSQAIERILYGFASETTVIDLDARTLEMAAERGLPTCQFFFELDPESGLDSFQLFPRPCLRLIEEQVARSREAGHTGVMDYRLAPNIHFPADYVLMRKLWQPELTVEQALGELAAQLCSDEGARKDFVRSVELAEEWWEKKQVECLRTATELAEAAAQAENAPSAGRLRVWADGVRALSVVADFASRGAVSDESLFAEMVDAVYAEMKASWIYQGLTAHEAWVGRSREMIGLRLKWWLSAAGVPDR